MRELGPSCLNADSNAMESLENPDHSMTHSGQASVRAALEAAERMEKEEFASRNAHVDSFGGLLQADELAEAVAASASATMSANLTIMSEVASVGRDLREMKAEVGELSRKQSDLWQLYRGLQKEQASSKLEALDGKLESVARAQRDAQVSENIILHLEQKLEALHQHVATLVQRHDDGKNIMSLAEETQSRTAALATRVDQITRQLAAEGERLEALRRTLFQTSTALDGRIQEAESVMRRQQNEIDSIRKLSSDADEGRRQWEAALGKVKLEVDDLAQRFTSQLLLAAPSLELAGREPRVGGCPPASPCISHVPVQQLPAPQIRPPLEVPMATATIVVDSSSPLTTPRAVPTVQVRPLEQPHSYSFSGMGGSKPGLGMGGYGSW